MIEKFECNGLWWLPNKSKEKIGGILKFDSNKGAFLELVGGSFKNIEGKKEKIITEKILEPKRREVILGISSNGKYITLHNCVEIPKSLSLFSLILNSWVYAERVFVGTHFEKIEDIKFKSVSVRYLYLDEWLNVSGFEMSFDKNNLRKEVVIKYQQPKPFSFEVNINDYKITLGVSFTLPKIELVQKEVSIKQRAYIQIESLKGEKAFDEYLNIIHHFQNFLSFAIMKPTYPFDVKGITDTKKRKVLLATREEIVNLPIKIYYRIPYIFTVPYTITSEDMLFTFRIVSDKFETFLKRWFGFSTFDDPYFEIIYNPYIDIKNQFLNLLRALEAYHRRTMNNFELPEGEHKKRIDEILSSVPLTHKGWLKEKLAYSNEPSLRKRLKEIFDKFSDVLNEFIPDKKGFIEKVVRTRNYFIHYDKTLEEKSAKGEELYNLTQKLKIVIEICLLETLGFSLDEIKNLIFRNLRYHQLLTDK